MIGVRSVERENFIVKLQKFGLTYKQFFLVQTKCIYHLYKIFGVFNLDYWMSTNILWLATNLDQNPHTFWNFVVRLL